MMNGDTHALGMRGWFAASAMSLIVCSTLQIIRASRFGEEQRLQTLKGWCNVRLSEALLLGETLRDWPLGNNDWRVCLCAVAIKAFGETNSANNAEARRRWPWLLSFMSSPSCLAERWDGFPPRRGEDWVTYLCLQVLSCGMTLEQAADAIREIEPPETIEVNEVSDLVEMVEKVVS
jgi:hypothetical protein